MSSTDDQFFLSVFSPREMSARFYEFGPFRGDPLNYELPRDGLFFASLRCARGIVQLLWIVVVVADSLT